MADVFLFADEAGCFTFKKVNGASQYFFLCTIELPNCSMSSDLLDIKRRLVSAGEADRKKLHATSDAQAVRDEVFDVITAHDFEIDVTILEKTKAQPQTRPDAATFYRYAWYYHFKHVGPTVCKPDNKTLITAAALGQKKSRAAFMAGVNNAAQSFVPRDRWEVSFIESSEDPCLWAADYCAWAIQRKWERGDGRSYDLIKDRIRSEFDLWRVGTKHYF